jgi:hypothetical protein
LHSATDTSRHVALDKQCLLIEVRMHSPADHSVLDRGISLQGIALLCENTATPTLCLFNETVRYNRKLWMRDSFGHVVYLPSE